MKNIFSADGSVKSRITDSISENLTDSDSESVGVKSLFQDDSVPVI